MMLSRKNALAMAKRFRTCPPNNIKRDHGSKDLIANHMKVCPYCKENATDMKDPWIQLYDGLKMFFEPAANVPTVEPAAGDVRKIRMKKALELKTKYFNPPAVLVLDAPKQPRGSVLVAQIYHDTAMAGPGDLIVQYPGIPDQAFFIETWNTYPIRSSDLGPPMFSISSNTLKAVHALRTDGCFLAAGFPVPVPMRKNDLRLEFRRMEAAMARVFSVGDLELSAQTAEKLRLPYKSASEAMAAIQAVSPGAFWHAPPDDALEAFLLAQLPDEMLPLAAADNTEPGGFASLYMRHKGYVISLSPLHFRVHAEMRGENIRAVSGCIQGGSQELSGTDLICMYETQHGGKISPSRLVWNDESGDFYIEFPSEAEKDDGGSVSLVLFKEADGI
jgi:hypothetical protein